ncbi:baeRF6 domain-containing protein [Loigolactobacillus zhaoyuanensis]|uniref:Bacterial archaeo-eukaryotic release factor family 6 domain-containing protein n=1 Tax=Loigolactobacillus zhaoyuanensis TaxID=2486017 RepID=A0ABW8UJA4_9LACO
MTTTTFTDLKTLLNELDQGPFVSIYFEMAPARQADKNRLTIKQLYKTVAQQFSADFPNLSWQPYEQQLTPLLTDIPYWQDELPTSFGIITSAAHTTLLRLDTAVAAQACVSSWPNLLPQIAAQQLAFNFDLLCLNRDSFQLYQVNAGIAEPVTLTEEAPTTLQKALGTEVSGGDLNFHSHAGGHGEHASYHGHNTADAEREIDHRNYYQAVADYLRETTTKRQRALVLFALTENQSLFRQLARNPYLAEHLTIERSPLNLTNGTLASELEPLQTEWQAELLAIIRERYDLAVSQKLVTTEREELRTAALAGQIDTLLIDRESITSPAADWLLEICDQVLRYQGRVRIFPTADYPANESVAAIKRYR